MKSRALSDLPKELQREVEQIVDRFEDLWKQGQRRDISQFLPNENPLRAIVLRALMHVDIEYRTIAGEQAGINEYVARFPELQVDDEFVSNSDRAIVHPKPDVESTNSYSTLLTIQGSNPVAGGNATLPERIGRYRVERVLGKGGFGLVFLAYDEKLERHVAVKVPHDKLVSRPEDAEAYLTEARTVASLDHPHIVVVHDVGSTEQFPCYIVSKYIDGTDLSSRLNQSRLSIPEAVELVATVAEALYYAHKQGLVHRDIKPGNILIDQNGTAFVVDFGLALREQDLGKGPQYAGTPAYMSPEQARGEGHRVDGRSDIFSLAVVLYELLIGRRPFPGDTSAELLEHITKLEPKPPRQIDDRIPKELDRICLKALSKRASERYSSAKDMADDLRHFLNGHSPSATSVVSLSITPAVQPASTLREAATATAPPSCDKPIRIVPKGLRSFDAYDANFFLELLPGPRDRDGLPDSLRFWKTRIEETDADSTFSVGLIYGPSGCGKSSLVKAGLLPRLADDVIVVYVEATASQTEARLVNGLHKRCPGLPNDANLTEMFAAIRRGQGVPAGKKKVLIIIDQFEQWLHAKKEERDTELVQALRQCDGGRLQSIVMVRDDFWLAISRFLQELEIRPVEGQNSAIVDLFDPDHGKKVLAAFGRTYGKIPETGQEMSGEQRQFLDHAVAGLAQEGKVISVRLALFAEMMKGKPWTKAVLEEVGGTEGVGVTFLEETFSSTSAPPQHRYHQKAAKLVLKALLPESGSDMKGHMRSYGDLLAASGYGSRTKDFNDLIEILSSEIRLITPTDPEGKPGAEDSVSQAQPGNGFYQLTHDYLVPRLRDWLSRKQKETRRGRAELALADLAAEWHARKQNRHLPSPWQWLQMQCLTSRKTRAANERKLMRRATRYYAIRGVLVAVLLMITTIIGFASQAGRLVQDVLNAEPAHVPTIIGKLAQYRIWTNSLLRAEFDKAEPDSLKKLNTSLALLPSDPAQVDYLYTRLLDARPQDVPVLSTALEPHKEILGEKLWAVAESLDNDKDPQRLRAASALARYDRESSRWAKVQKLVGDDLVGVSAGEFPLWLELLRPIRAILIAPLSEVYRDPNRRDFERSLATESLANYCDDLPAELTELVLDADQNQFKKIYPKFEQYAEAASKELVAVVNQRLPKDAQEEMKEQLGKRQANAGVILLKGQRADTVWPLLRHSEDPRARSYLIHRLGPFGADSQRIINRLEGESDVSVQCALLLCLGEFGDEALSPQKRDELRPRLEKLYSETFDAGLHAALEWILTQWQDEKFLKQSNEQWASDNVLREQRLDSIRSKRANDDKKAIPLWYVNSQGQTMVVIPGPAEFFWMGSPETEVEREDDETMHKIRIGRTFALASTLVTVEQYKKLADVYEPDASVVRSTDSPAVGIDWYQAALYCNRLSALEGMSEEQRCYETLNGEGEQSRVVRLRNNYLGLSGYRLATEAELEYATRAGARTARYFGETDELLPKYAWFTKNSQRRTWPVGKLKPNDFGLFDLHGNANTWCQEVFKDYPAETIESAVDDVEDSLAIIPTATRLFRGGSYKDDASLVRSAYRNTMPPDQSYKYLGFRLARTLRPSK